MVNTTIKNNKPSVRESIAWILAIIAILGFISGLFNTRKNDAIALERLDMVTVSNKLMIEGNARSIDKINSLLVDIATLKAEVSYIKMAIQRIEKKVDE